MPGWESPLVCIIFGATGDLMHRKLMPALYSLYQKKEVSQNLFIVGVGRRELTQDQFRELMAIAVQERFPPSAEVATSSVILKPKAEESLANARTPIQARSFVRGSAGTQDDKNIGFDLNVWGSLVDGMYYQQGYFEDPNLYKQLVQTLARFDQTMKACVPRLFYLATPPNHYETILNHLHVSNLSEGCGHGAVGGTRILIEKPFGKDLKTARKLDNLLASIFEEKQIYRIDHYLGRETVQNILAFRFANGIFEPTWNRQFIDHIQITLAEKIGIESRGVFYDGVGALRDVVQNHMLQMLALIAMEQPARYASQSVAGGPKAFDPLSIRDARTRALQSIVNISPKRVSRSVVRGQYKGYKNEKHIDPISTTETFVALKLALSTKRWQGVPFYLRTGKHLAKKAIEISIHYKKPKVCLGKVCLFNEETVFRNVLVIRIQPGEGMSLRLMMKEPGFGMKLAPVHMKFSYDAAFSKIVRSDPYEKLLLDAMVGDQTLFARTDETMASWKLVTNILKGWAKYNPPLFVYEPGSMGPKQADALIQKDTRHWFLEENSI